MGVTAGVSMGAPRRGSRSGASAWREPSQVAVLDAMQPAGVTAALEALEPMGAAHDTKRQAATLALEKARYEAQRAGRQYDLVDPENRLVAGEREHRWHEALARMTALEAHLATLQSQRRTLNEEQRL